MKKNKFMLGLLALVTVIGEALGAGRPEVVAEGGPTRKKKITGNMGIVLICAMYFVISLVLFQWMTGGKAIISNDTLSYIRPARNLLSSAFFSGDGNTPEYFRTPGYPLYLALVYALGGSDTVAAFGQILLMTLKVAIAYRILLLLNTPKKLSLLGAALFLLNVQSYGYSFSLISEPLFGFLLMVSLFFLVKFFYHGRNLWNFLAFTLTLNYAMFVRPILIYFNMLTAAALLVFLILRKLSWKHFLAFFLCFTLFWGGWSFRNYAHSGVFTFSTVQKVNQALYDAPLTAMYIENQRNITDSDRFRQLHDIFKESFFRQYPEAGEGRLNDAQISLLQGEFGSAYIKAHFPQYIAASFQGLMVQMFKSFGTTLLFRETTVSAKMLILAAVQVGLVIYLCIIYALYLAGLFLNRKEAPAIHICIFLLAGYLAFPGAIQASPRFRDPLLPLVLVSAAANSKILIRLIGAKIPIPWVNRTAAWLLDDTTERNV